MRFGKDRRLLRRAEFLKVYDAGRRLRGRVVTIVALRAEPGGDGAPKPWRVGITASRKTGGAVQRNRQKRRLREFFRLNQHQIPNGWDLVVNTTDRLNQASHEELTRELARLIRGLEPSAGRDGNAR